MAELGPLVIGIGKAVWQVASVGTDQQRERALQLLHETRRGLYGILAEDPDDELADDPGDAAAEVEDTEPPRNDTPGDAAPDEG
jgi:hypothetical protein